MVIVKLWKFLVARAIYMMQWSRQQRSNNVSGPIRRLGETSEPADASAHQAARAGFGDAQFVAEFEAVLHDLWNLGRNLVLGWCPAEGGVELLVVPHYVIAGGLDPAQERNDRAVGNPHAFIQDLLGGDKQLNPDIMHSRCKALGFPPTFVKLDADVGQVAAQISEIVKRFGITYVGDRAVTLFDIVGFSLFSPLEQVTQLNSLSYAVNAAHSKMLSKKIDISFARTTTGDGFYIWNRDRSIQANINLYHFMHLVLADNAIARAKSSGNVTPLLRAAFHVGGHYEFYQSEGLNPTIYSYIVGDVTIELARLIERTVPGQVVVGDFDVPMPDAGADTASRVDTVDFIERTQETLSSLEGLVLSGEPGEAIKCYLTGEHAEDDSYTVKKYLITDKHGLTRHAYNAKINIYRGNSEPIFLGVQDHQLGSFADTIEGLEIVLEDM